MSRRYRGNNRRRKSRTRPQTVYISRGGYRM